MTGRREAREILASASVFCAMALVVLDAGMTSIALPTIAARFDVAPATAILVASAYQLALLIGIIPSAHLGERIGNRRLFILGLLLFTIASLFAAGTTSFALLVAARFLQGLGGAAIMALGIALMRATLGTARLAPVIGWHALNVALCAAAGPAIGALIIAVADWQWLFLANVPIGLFALAAARALPLVPPLPGTIDPPGILLFAAAAGLLFLTIQNLVDRPLLALPLAGLFLVAGRLLLDRERRGGAPLLPLDLLADRQFRLAATASISCFVAQAAGQLALAFHLQLTFDRGLVTAGALLASWPLTVALGSPLVNWLAARRDAGILCAGGALLLFAGLVGLHAMGPEASAIMLLPCIMLCGAGFGLFQVPSNQALFLGVPANRAAAAGGVQGTARLTGQLGGSLFLALLFAAAPMATAPRLAFALAAMFALGAALFSLRRTANFEGACAGTADDKGGLGLNSEGGATIALSGECAEVGAFFAARRPGGGRPTAPLAR